MSPCPPCRRAPYVAVPPCRRAPHATVQLYYVAYNFDDEGGNPKQGWTDVVDAMVQDAYNR